MGYCNLDQQLAHAYYHCSRHVSATQRFDTCGLTDGEIEWLRTHAKTPAARELIAAYRLVEAAPEDPAARGVFTGMLERWRGRHTGEKSAASRAKA